MLKQDFENYDKTIDLDHVPTGSINVPVDCKVSVPDSLEPPAQLKVPIATV